MQVILRQGCVLISIQAISNTTGRYWTRLRARDSAVNNKQSCEQRRLRYLLLSAKQFYCCNLVLYFSSCQSQERRHASAHVHTKGLTRTLDTAILPTVLCQGTAAASGHRCSVSALSRRLKLTDNAASWVPLCILCTCKVNGQS